MSNKHFGKYKLSRKSIRNLEGAHPDLVAVIQLAIWHTTVDFGVLESLRDEHRQKYLYNTGATTTINSLHLKQFDGYAHAVDLFAWVPEVGGITYEHKYFRKIIQACMTAAIELRVQIEAGGLWRDFVDSPHIQLNQNYYGRKS